MADHGDDGSREGPRSGDDASVSQIFKLIAWMFLPRIIAEFLLGRYYDVAYRGAAMRPRPGTARYQSHFVRVYVALIALYLLYSLGEVYYGLPANYYDLFGLTPATFDLKAVKRQWRAISLEHHPDKNLGGDSAAGLDTFLQFRGAVDVLQNPLHRWAYTKFGPSIFEDCAHCLTEGEYVHAGLPQTLGFYLGTGVVLLLLSLLGKASSGRYWRWVGFAALGVVELNLVMRQDDFLPWLYPSRTVSEKIGILHQLYWAFTVGLSQVHPFLAPPPERTDTELRELVAELHGLNEQAAADQAAEFADVFRPFADQASQDRLHRQIEMRTTETVLLRDPHVALARRNALQRIR